MTVTGEVAPDQNYYSSSAKLTIIFLRNIFRTELTDPVPAQRTTETSLCDGEHLTSFVGETTRLLPRLSKFIAQCRA